MDSEIKKITEEILNKLTVSFSNINTINKDGRLVFMVNINDARFIIGGNGNNLYAINHIVKRVARKRINNMTIPSFFIDINNYQTNKNIEIINKTKILGDRVKSFCVNIEMEPMPSHERMIVHSIFTEDDNIETKSVGLGEKRRVVLMFKKN
jgi:spoIIIJ-associated protein